MTPVLVLNVVGLTRSLLAKFPGKAPAIEGLAADGQSATLGTVLPAVTTTVQSTFLTGLMPREHGIVANGWYFRDLAEVHFWKQSNYLVTGEKVWDTGHRRSKDFISAQVCWWYNMYSSNDIAVTMRPYEASNRVVSLLYTTPPELADELQEELGPFPLFQFWGPKADIVSSEWIERCTRSVRRRYSPSLTLVYLPHLDYDLQRLGPEDPRIGEDLARIDAVVGRLATEARAQGTTVVVLSEYGMSQVTDAIHLNRVLRSSGVLEVQRQLDWELLDCGASRAFGVCDHQVAHVYVRHPSDIGPVKKCVEQIDGVERVLDEEGKKEFGLDHPRSGELVAIAAPNRWFSYHYWEDDALAPEWAREVEIHAKPGYDPLELFCDPDATLPLPRMIARLAFRKLGFNVGPIFNFVPFRTDLIKGSHGRLPETPEDGPLFVSSSKDVSLPDHLEPTQVKETLLKLVFGSE